MEVMIIMNFLRVKNTSCLLKKCYRDTLFIAGVSESQNAPVAGRVRPQISNLTGGVGIKGEVPNQYLTGGVGIKGEAPQSIT